jgi:hypothetical protein
MTRRDELPAHSKDRTRAAACIVLIAALLSGCGGGDDDSGSRPPAADRGTAELPGYMRKTMACLRGAGIRVRVPAALRRALKRGDFRGKSAQGVEGGFLFFLAFDRKQKFTQAQFRAARRCYDER